MSKRIQPIYRHFGLRVREIRITLGMRQEELAARVGLVRTSIVNIEQGRQRVLLDDVEKFSKAFGVSPRHLMRGIWT